MKPTRKDFSSELEPKPFSLIWEHIQSQNYKLYYKNKLIGEGMAPRDLVGEYVRLMNWAYSEGLNEK